MSLRGGDQLQMLSSGVQTAPPKQSALDVQLVLQPPDGLHVYLPQSALKRSIRSGSVPPVAMSGARSRSFTKRYSFSDTVWPAARAERGRSGASVAWRAKVSAGSTRGW